jgi:hypothetical protein
MVLSLCIGRRCRPHAGSSGAGASADARFAHRDAMPALRDTHLS